VNDDELIKRLGGAFPPVTEHTLALGHAAFAWYVPAATLAAVTSDTAGPPPGVRGGGARTLTFGGAGVSVEIEVCGREIVGQLMPPAGAEVLLRSPSGERGTRTDEAGGFVLLDVPSGPVSLLFRLGDATSVVTSWIRV
jgi:hypothetical protein